MLARENPHCGVSGVPFMNRTTGAEATALSMAALVSAEMKRACKVVAGPEANDQGLGMTLPFGTDRAMPREAWMLLRVNTLIRAKVAQKKKPLT